MKIKTLALGMTLLMMATMVRAECPGTPVTGYNGNSYCAGNVQMNWWSAFAWCDAIGGTLFDVTADCACSGSSCPNVGGGYCANLYNKVPNGTYWSRNEVAGQSTKAYYVYNSTLSISTDSKSALHPKPICRM